MAFVAKSFGTGALCCLLALGSALPALAGGKVCGTTIHKKFGETRAKFGSAIASLKPDGSGHVVVYRIDKSAPLGWSHALRVFKADRASQWQVQLTAVQPDAVADQGFVIAIDETRTVGVGVGQIGKTISVNEWTLEFGATEINGLVFDMIKGARLSWRYRTPDQQEFEAAFSLDGFAKAIQFVNCGLDGDVGTQ